MTSSEKRRRGRPTGGQPRRLKFVTLRLRDDERELLREAARARGKGMADFARSVSLYASRKILAGNSESTINTDSTSSS